MQSTWEINIPDHIWEMIASQFNQQEMAGLCCAFTARAVRPWGYVVNRHLMEDELVTKILRAVAKAKETLEIRRTMEERQRGV